MKIGELARITGVKAETIRFYEREGILPSPARTGANYRDYDLDQASRLHFIRCARDLGFTMARVRELLDLADDQSRSCEAVDTLTRDHLSEIERKISDLTALRSELTRMLASCEQDTVGDCRIIEALAKDARG